MNEEGKFLISGISVDFFLSWEDIATGGGVCVPACMMLAYRIIFCRKLPLGRVLLPCLGKGRYRDILVSVLSSVQRAMCLCTLCFMCLAVKWVSISHNVPTDITISRKCKKG